MREKGRRKKGRTWAEAARTVRRRERRGEFFFSPAARRREREVTWPRDRAEGHESARRGRRLGSRWRALRLPRHRSRGCRFSRGLRPDPLVFQSGVASRGSSRCRPHTVSPCFGTVCCACPVTGSSPLCALESPDWMQTGGGLCVHPAPERRGERWSSVAFPPPERSCHQTRGPLLIWLGEPTGGHEAFVFAFRAESARGV